MLATRFCVNKTLLLTVNNTASPMGYLLVNLLIHPVLGLHLNDFDLGPHWDHHVNLPSENVESVIV